MVALQCCLEQLEPNRDNLENADNKLIWCNQVQCIRPIIQSIQVMKSLISGPSQQQIGNVHTKEILQHCRCVLVQSSWSICISLYLRLSVLIGNLGQNRK